eukprot:633130-Pyramimonas_sp.AAC.1
MPGGGANHSTEGYRGTEGYSVTHHCLVCAGGRGELPDAKATRRLRRHPALFIPKEAGRC